MKKDLQKVVGEALAEGKAVKEIINEVKDFSNKNTLAEHEVIAIVSYSSNYLIFFIFSGFFYIQLWQTKFDFCVTRFGPL